MFYRNEPYKIADIKLSTYKMVICYAYRYVYESVR